MGSSVGVGVSVGSAVSVGVGVAVRVAVTVGVAVRGRHGRRRGPRGVAVRVAVSVGSGVAVGVDVGSGVSVAVGVGVGVAVGVTVAVGVAVVVGVAPGPGVSVAVGVALAVGVAVAVSVGSGVAVAVGVAVVVGVAVRVGIGVGRSTLHSAGYIAAAGAPAAATQSDVKLVTQLTHLIMSSTDEIAPPHGAADPGGSTGGHSSTKPMLAMSGSSSVPQTWSGPPHAAHIFAIALPLAFVIASSAFSFGHGAVIAPFSTRSSHFPRILPFAWKNLLASLPSPTWHFRIRLFVVGVNPP